MNTIKSMKKEKIIEVYWVDTTEHTNETVNNNDDDPLIYLVSVGYDYGKFTDKNGTEYLKLCYKKCVNAENNDDFIVIPLACIKKIKVVK